MPDFSISHIIHVIKARKSQSAIEDVESDCRLFCANLLAAMGDKYGKFPDYSHAFLSYGWGGQSQSRNLLLQLLFGGIARAEWLVFFGPCGIGVIDQHAQYHHYDVAVIKKIQSNGADGSMIRIYMKGVRYLELRFDTYFAGEHPSRLLNAIVLGK